MVKDDENSEEILAQLSGLYQSEPDRFEELREKLIKQAIESYPESYQKRAYGLQFQLDAQLGKYKDPVVRMNKMVEIFWQQFNLFKEALQNPDDAMAAIEKQKKDTRIISFENRKNKNFQEEDN